MRKANGIIAAAFILVLLLGGVLYALRKSPPASNTAKDTPSTKITSKRQPSNSNPTSKPQTFDKAQYSLDDPVSIWVVVDKQRPLNPKAYAPDDLAPVGGGQYMRSTAASAFASMVAAAKTAGYSLTAESGYRSYGTQVSVYSNEVKNFGQTIADTESARPGYSEHQTGWAIDIATAGCIEDCFGGTAAGKWALENAAKYGFTQRYPESKSAITGYRHEPWHYRYVGTELAQELVKTGQTLEEFFGLPPAPNY